MFIDSARVFVKAGSGGSGCTSYERQKGKKYGRPDGGNGGDGGDIVITASKCIHTLLDYHYNQHFKAERGHHGRSNNKTGRRGSDSVILVPCGTVIRDAVTSFALRDLVNNGDSVIIAKGGSGGRGNVRRREGTPGMPGEEKELIFELKLIADVGIIGYPNAGKSTFISRVSSAKSKIAGYPFTTKVPILGIVRRRDDTLTFADMPGLMEGAHEGRGLGDRFLKHIERTRILIHMTDVSMAERPDPLSDIKTIEDELGLYGHGVAEKPRVIALNKIDVPEGREAAVRLEGRLKGIKVFPVSAVTGEGIGDLLDHVFEMARAVEGEGE
ncbi:MAG: Obg family GTPase CgtA [Candidatus Omnitrophota bacterium]